jgi:hypothetical protein
MRTFIQLRNGVGYASVITPTDEPDHTITPDHTTVIEVFTADPDQFLKKKYDAETKTWSDAPVYRYAEVNNDGVPVEIKRTVWEHEIPHASLIMPDEANGLWKLIDGEWIAPVIYVPSETVEQAPQGMIESPHVEAEAEQN